jgi:hypothetical protein
MTEPLMNQTYYKEDQLALLEDITSVNIKLQLLATKYISRKNIVPVTRVNLQSVAQTLQSFHMSVVMSVESLPEQEGDEAPELPPMDIA